MKYSSIVPAQDWFFHHENINSDKPPILYQVAVWASYETTDENGNEQAYVTGLIAADFGPSHEEANRRLHTPPPVNGRYLHRDQLTEVELAQIRKR